MVAGGISGGMPSQPMRRATAPGSSRNLTALALETGVSPAPGLNSRRNVERLLSTALARSESHVLAILDVDRFRLFKNLNGMAAADALLRTLSRRLRSMALAAGGRFVCLGGDEFVIVAPAARLGDDATVWTRALLAEASASFAHRGQMLSFSATLGFALLPDHGKSFEEALHCARLAVDDAKAAGGGSARRCSPNLVRDARGRDERARQLDTAIERAQIIPYYQPVIALASGAIAGLEVLARWKHPREGILEPANFIPLAEERGLCRDITCALLEQVRRDARDWPKSWHFAFNTTPRDVMDVLGFIEGPGTDGYDLLDPSRIELEVTENAVMRDLIESRDRLAAFAPYGVKLVMDDFGMGYANFQQLRQMPFARLKIDKSFILDLLEDPRAAACVHAIIQLAHHLGMTATAEGVETAAVADRLAAMECDYAQGYFYARPMPASEVARLADVPRFATSGFDHAA